MKTKYLLAADIGGTNSRFALFSVNRVPGGLLLGLLPGGKITLPTAASGSFADLLAKLARTKTASGEHLIGNPARPLCGASIAVPGVVRNGRCDAANIVWPLAEEDVSAATGTTARLFNDFAAQGQACLYPEVLGLEAVLPGTARKNAPAVVLGAGTGLGKAVILPETRPKTHPKMHMNGGAMPAAPESSIPESSRPDGSTDGPPHPPLRIALPEDSAMARQALQSISARVLPSEFGHCAFPFSLEEESGFASFMRKVSGRREVIGDMAVSGYGLAALFAWFAWCGKTDTLPRPESVTPVLHEHPQALEWLARFYGRACRHSALDSLALGGIYLSGGLIAHVPGLCGHPAFEEEFRRSKGQAETLKNIPVWRVSNPDAGLWGAALHGLNLAL